MIDDCLNKDINNTKIPVVKRCWNIGGNTVVVIDKKLVQILGLHEENTFFEEELTDGGILLRIKRLD
jgi:hypothetical protein